MASTRQQRRQIERRRAREEARRAAERAARRRRQLRFALPIAVFVIIAGAVAWAALSGDDKETVEAGKDETTTTTAATGGAAGKPCVKLADPLPAGAPDVPVKEGPPPTELVKEDLKVGDGAEVKAGEKVKAHYIGVACSTGKIFDSSWSKGQPIEFELTGVVKGWQDGIPGMKVGGRRLLGIPPEQGYGAQGSPPDIQPNETLWFVVDIVDVVK